ncbi:MAG: sterol desaturase family protein [Bacteroidota bacterium]|nr:sterol desaturase family protein [Bacteroidota bacterium]
MYKEINDAIKSLYEKKGTKILGGLALILFLLESKFNLRRRNSSRIERFIKNGEIAATAAIGLRYVLLPAMVWASFQSETGRKGLVYYLPLHTIFKNVIGFLLVDYGNYLWHRLSHKSGILWRFHQVHHSDLDLDLSTAFRFHIGEIIPSAIFRAAVVRLVGLNWRGVLVYEIAFEAANSFHHSNLKLPGSVAKRLSAIIVTPPMHGIHHSIIREEADSNFSVIFSLWDRLHQTLKLDIPQEEINIGLPAFRDEKELNWYNLMLMPISGQRQWELPDGAVPVRS